MKMNKNALLVAVAASALIGASGSALAATATGDASGEVVKPIAIAKNVALSFGQFAHSGTTQSTVVLKASDGTRTATGSVVLLSGGAGAAGTFDVSGANSATYAVTVPTSASLALSTDTTKTMSFAPSYYSVGSATSNGTGTLSGTGADTLKVGGTLTVGDGTVTQPQGTYTGTYNVTVEYN
jgi:hypothetical protein